MKNSRLIFFPLSYPFSIGEEYSFINDEIKILSSYFEKVLIYPTIIRGNQYDMPDNCEVKLEYAKSLSKTKNHSSVFNLFLGLTNLTFIREYFNNKKHYNSFKKILTLIIYNYKLQKKVKWVEQNLTVRPNDIIYSFWFTNTTNSLTLAKNTRELNIVTRVHGIDLYENRSFNNIPFRKMSLDQINLIATISEKGKDYLIDKYPKIQDKIKCHYLGFSNIENFFSETSRDGIFRVVSCSSVIPLKRVELIYMSLQKVAEKIKSKLEWTHIGGGDLLNELKQNTLGESNLKINFLGKITHEEIIDFYKNEPVDLFLHASETEGLPMVMIEAASFGVPIISTNVGGVSEIVIDGFNGYLVDGKGDVNEIASTVCEFFLLDKEEKLIIRNNGKKLYSNKFNSINNAHFFAKTLIEL